MQLGSVQGSPVGGQSVGYTHAPGVPVLVLLVAVCPVSTAPVPVVLVLPSEPPLPPLPPPVSTAVAQPHAPSNAITVKPKLNRRIMRPRVPGIGAAGEGPAHGHGGAALPTWAPAGAVQLSQKRYRSLRSKPSSRRSMSPFMRASRAGSGEGRIPGT
jgi:hypothetical protein